MKVTRSAFYAATHKTVIASVDIRLETEIKSLFKKHHQRIGSRQIKSLLHSKGFKVGRYKVSQLMKKAGLYCLQRKAKFRNKLNKGFKYPVN